MTDKVRRYAEGTEIDADKSRAEVEALLHKHGATEFALFRDASQTKIVYRMRGRMVQHVVLRPDPKQFEFIKRYHRRSAAAVASCVEAEWKRKWRALLLIVKAKLELVASGEREFEHEFMADVLLPNGQTVGEAMIPRIAASYDSGEMPPLMLGRGT